MPLLLLLPACAVPELGPAPVLLAIPLAKRCEDTQLGRHVKAHSKRLCAEQALQQSGREEWWGEWHSENGGVNGTVMELLGTKKAPQAC